ncbi:MAG: hypothetical protein IPI40_15410 [Betaproteobacteria bacterium]|nr:hypothetical protein [Betaproteobacteria bacterium]
MRQLAQHLPAFGLTQLQQKDLVLAIVGGTSVTGFPSGKSIATSSVPSLGGRFVRPAREAWVVTAPGFSHGCLASS